MTIDDEELDRLLKKSELQPPAHFTDSVMQRIYTESDVAAEIALVEKPMLWQTIAQWFALVLGTALGIAQCLYFALGLWMATAVS